MMYMITPKHFGECIHEIQEMHRLRYRVPILWTIPIRKSTVISAFATKVCGWVF